MSLKYVNQKDLERLKAEAGYIQRSIAEVKEISRGGDEGIKVALKMLKDYRDKVGSLKNNCLLNPNHAKMMRCLGFAGEERALNHVINLFENPKTQLEFYNGQLTVLDKTIKEWEKLHVRQ